jgi:hypothetical protein
MNIIECPVCHARLEGYTAQVRGSESLVCPICSAHFYSAYRAVGSTIPKVDIERFMPESGRYSPYLVPELNEQVFRNTGRRY